MTVEYKYDSQFFKNKIRLSSWQLQAEEAQKGAKIL
jgi:hypothetical protein